MGVKRGWQPSYYWFCLTNLKDIDDYHPCVKPIVSAVLYIALELSSKEWKLAFADSLSRNPRIRTIKVAASFYLTERELVKEIADAKKALAYPKPAKL